VAPCSFSPDPEPAPSPFPDGLTPLQRWEDPLFDAREVEVWVKRDDLADPWTGGNKRRKLAGLLHPDRLRDKEGIYSFGGPFSNHLAAVAAEAARRGLSSHGYVRGWPVDNPVLDFLRKEGMTLSFLPPMDFKRQQLHKPPERRRWLGVPMGGAHALALPGSADIVREIRQQSGGRITHYAVPAGTGNTAAGMALALEEGQTLLVFPAFRLSDPRAWLQTQWANWQTDLTDKVQVASEAALGRFGSKDPALWQWLLTLAADSGLAFDPIYNGPMAFHLRERIRAASFPPGSILALVHTGGLAGRRGYAWRHRLSPMAGDPAD
jgi:1-aminocyclopropane-1-carboxylate deaminase